MQTVKRTLVIQHTPTGNVTKREEVTLKVTPKRLTVVEGICKGQQFYPESGQAVSPKRRLTFYRKYLETL